MNKKLNKKKIIGIDYSLTSPAICITDSSFKFETSEFFFLTNKKKLIGKISDNIYGFEHEEYIDPIERFSNISNWVLSRLPKSEIDNVFIEGYSFGSKGQGIFQIAENCGILKYKILYEQKLKYRTVVPSVVKKKATGKGNADKEKMYEQFKKDHKVDLMKMFDMQKLNNPITDIIDSYYIAKAGSEL